MYKFIVVVCAFWIYVYNLTLFFEKKNGVIDSSTYIYNYNKYIVIIILIIKFYNKFI